MHYILTRFFTPPELRILVIVAGGCEPYTYAYDEQYIYDQFFTKNLNHKYIVDTCTLGNVIIDQSHFRTVLVDLPCEVRDPI